MLARLEAREDLLFGRRADARHVVQARRRQHRARKSSGRLDTERSGDLDHPLWRDAEKPAEPDELGPDASLAAPRALRSRPSTELAEAGRDSRPDAAQLLLAPLADELQIGALVSRIVAAARR